MSTWYLVCSIDGCKQRVRKAGCLKIPSHPKAKLTNAGAVVKSTGIATLAVSLAILSRESASQTT